MMATSWEVSGSIKRVFSLLTPGAVKTPLFAVFHILDGKIRYILSYRSPVVWSESCWFRVNWRFSENLFMHRGKKRFSCAVNFSRRMTTCAIYVGLRCDRL